MRILVVDDEKNVADFLKENLEYEYFVVDTAYDGAKGSYLARVNDYDLIILDYILPLKSGKDVCEEIRKAKKTTPILMLSVKSETTDRVEMLNIGADDFLAKPFSFAELLARIKAILRRPRQIEEDILTVDNLVLDAKKHAVKRKDKEIYLTRKEYNLLDYMMRHAGRALSRGMLLEHVWENEADPLSNTVESHIASLRKKIDSGRKKKLIQTIPGKGYKIQA
ncbi:DNA-binding response regulator [Candidatus Parcubacteria bacterium]|nr:MAG: DNA-binding response regulator [Candidatus Parcubacteria bacterium]